MPGGQLPEDDTPETVTVVEHAPLPPSPTAPHHPANVECGFCGAQVTTTRGEVLRLSTRAKALRDAEHDIERLTKQVENLTRDLAEARAKLLPPAKRDAISDLLI
jgi:hypothetical protein